MEDNSFARIKSTWVRKNSPFFCVTHEITKTSFIISLKEGGTLSKKWREREKGKDPESALSSAGSLYSTVRRACLALPPPPPASISPPRPELFRTRKNTGQEKQKESAKTKETLHARRTKPSSPTFVVVVGPRDLAPLSTDRILFARPRPPPPLSCRNCHFSN